MTVLLSENGQLIKDEEEAANISNDFFRQYSTYISQKEST